MEDMHGNKDTKIDRRRTVVAGTDGHSGDEERELTTVTHIKFPLASN